MASKLIRLHDGALVEVEITGQEAREISGGLAERVDSSFGEIGPLLEKVCRPVSDAWRKLNRNRNLAIDAAEIQFGLSFEGSGNLFVTKAKAGANLTVKLTLKPMEIKMDTENEAQD